MNWRRLLNTLVGDDVVRISIYLKDDPRFALVGNKVLSVDSDESEPEMYALFGLKDPINHNIPFTTYFNTSDILNVVVHYKGA